MNLHALIKLCQLRKRSTVTSGNFPEHDGLFDSSVFLSGDTFEFTFSDAGTFDYYCFVHPWMAGIVTVS